MRFYTHLVAGLLVAVVLVEIMSFPNTIAAVLIVLFGAVLPDVDEKHSRLGKLFPVVPKLFVHRGFFHSLALATALIIVTFFVTPDYALAFAAGFFSHLLLDAMTPSGVKPFWPSQVRIKGFVRTGGAVEAIIFFLLIGVVLWLLLQ